MDKPNANEPQSPPEMPAPTADPTNPHNQQATGDWSANERTAERRNNEPGLTEEERKRRRW